MEKGKKAFLIVAGIAIVLLGIYLVMDNNGGSVDTPLNGQNGSIVTPGAEPSAKSGITPNDLPKNGYITAIDSSKITPVSPESKKEIDKLQDLLDDEDKRDEACAQAVKMAKEGDEDQILAALDAFRWLGGRDSKVALVELMKRDDDLASRATEALQSIFQADTIDDDRNFDTDVWLDAFSALTDDAEREAFLILLTSNPPEVSAPTLIKLWQDAKDDSTKDLAREYFESLAGGIEILNVDAAQKWLEEYKVKKEQEEKELDE